MNRRRSLALSLGCLAAMSVMTITAVSPANGDDGRREVHAFQTTPTTPATAADAFVDDLSRCHFGADGNITEPCVVPITPVPDIDTTITGDIVGVMRSADAALVATFIDIRPASFDAVFVEYLRFEGSIAGCGSGSIVFRVEGRVGATTITWASVPNSGRGDLAGVSGSGSTLTGFDGPGGTSSGVVTGRFRCGKHHD